MPVGTEYLLYSKGDNITLKQIVDIGDGKISGKTLKNTFFQIFDTSETKDFTATPSDPNVYYCKEIKKGSNTFKFHPLNEYLFDIKDRMEIAKEKTVGQNHTEVVFSSDLLGTKYKIFEVNVTMNRAGPITNIPIVGSTVNSLFGYIPGSSLVTDAVQSAQGAVTGAVKPYYEQGKQLVTQDKKPTGLLGGKRKQKSRKSKSRKQKKSRKTKRSRRNISHCLE
jgi:hypothetical protein